MQLAIETVQKWRTVAAIAIAIAIVIYSCNTICSAAYFAILATALHFAENLVAQ